MKYSVVFASPLFFGHELQEGTARNITVFVVCALAVRGYDKLRAWSIGQFTALRRFSFIFASLYSF